MFPILPIISHRLHPPPLNTGLHTIHETLQVLSVPYIIQSWKSIFHCEINKIKYCLQVTTFRQISSLKLNQRWRTNPGLQVAMTIKSFTMAPNIVGAQCVTCLLWPFWRPVFWTLPWNFWKFVHTWTIFFFEKWPFLCLQKAPAVCQAKLRQLCVKG